MLVINNHIMILFILIVCLIIIIIIFSYKEAIKVHNYGFKFSINQTVYLVYNDKLTEGIINSIEFTREGVYYRIFLHKYDDFVKKTEKFIIADKDQRIKLLYKNDL